MSPYSRPPSQISQIPALDMQLIADKTSQSNLSLSNMFVFPSSLTHIIISLTYDSPVETEIFRCILTITHELPTVGVHSVYAVSHFLTQKQRLTRTQNYVVHCSSFDSSKVTAVFPNDIVFTHRR